MTFTNNTERAFSRAALANPFTGATALGDPTENIGLDGDGISDGPEDPAAGAQLTVPLTPNIMGKPVPEPLPIAGASGYEKRTAEKIKGVGKTASSAFAAAAGWNGGIGSDAKKLFDMGMIPRMSYATQGSGSGYMRDFQVYLLLDEMADRNMTIAKAERVIELSLRSLPRRFQFRGELLPGEETKAAEIIEFLEWVRRGGDRVAHDSTAGLYSWSAAEDCLALGTLRHGYSVCENVWDIAPGGQQFVKQFRHAHPGYFYFNANGELIPGPAYGDQAWEPAHPLKFMIARETGLYSTPFGDSAVWKCRWLYQWWKYATEGWVDWCTLFGTPFLLITYPDKEIDKIDWGTKAANMLRNLSAEAGIAAPEGVKIESVNRTAGAGGSTPNQELIHWIESLLNSFLLGGELNTAQSTNGRGSEAMGRVHQDNTDMIVAGYARIVEAAMLRGCIIPMVAANFGAEWADRIEYVIETESDRDIEQSIKIIETAAKNGIPMGVTQAQEMLTIEAPKPEEETVRQAAPPPMFPGGGPGGGDGPPERIEAEEDEEDEADDEDGMQSAFAEGGAARNGKAPFGGATDAEAPCGCGAVIDVARFAEEADDAKERAIRDTERAYLLADAAVDAFNVSAVVNVESFARALRNAVPNEADKLTTAAVNKAFSAFNMRPEEIARAMELPVTAARAMALLDALEVAKATLPAASIPPAAVSKVDPYYRRAYDWMRERDVMSRDDLKRLAQAQQLFEPGKTAAQIEREIRRTTLALAQEPAVIMGDKLKETMASAIGEGKTASQVLSELDSLTNEGRIPPAMDGYARTVFRTESSNAYTAQKIDTMKSEDAARKEAGTPDFEWGIGLTNGRLPSSRPSHAATDGMLIKKGSAAWDYFFDELQGTPYSYNCTCAWYVITDPDGADSTEYEETPGALEILRNVATFETKEQG